MTLEQFREYVAANIDWFRGRSHETDSSLQHAEEALGIQLPISVKWLLKEHGYWHGTGISNLEDTLKDTLDARRHVALPHRFVVLENLQDGGIILIDTGEVASSGEAPLYWVGMEDLGCSPRLAGNTRYESFGEYVKERLPSVQGFIEERYVRYNPSDYSGGAG